MSVISHGTVFGQMQIWHVDTMTWVAWDGSVSGATGGGVASTVNQGTAGVSAWKVDGSAVTQPVSLAVAPTTPVTGTFFQSTQPVSLASAPTTPITNANLDVALSTRTKPADQQHTIIDSGTTVVTQPTGTNLHVVVDSAPSTAVTGTFFQSTQPVSLPAGTITTLTPPAAITGFALEAGHLAAIDTATAKIPAQGQALAAASTPVVLPATQITTLTPPAAIVGFALEAGHLATIDTSTAKIPSQGQALAASSLPVVLTAIQQAALTPPAAITGFALEAGHLATIDTSTARIPAQGQALASASLPVVLTAAQASLLTPPSAITGFALEAGHLATIDTTTANNFTQNGVVISLLSQLLVELQLNNLLLQSGLNVRDDLDSLRMDLGPYKDNY